MNTRMAFIMLSLIFSSNVALAIVNGAELSEPQHPEISLLLMSSKKLKANEMVRVSVDDFESVCSGSFISDQLVLTAGHCLTDGSKSLYPYLARKKGSAFHLTEPVSAASAYVSEERDGVSAVGGCSARLKPLPETKTLDLALILFPPQTSDRWFEINPSYVPAVGDKLVYFGFGSTIDPFTNSGAIGIRKSAPALRFSQSKVWRASQQRVGFVAPQHLAFAAEGDSGGPVLVDRKLVGVVSTLSERCESEWGHDYAMLNTSSLISTSEAKLFIEQALNKFKSLRLK